MQISFHMHLMSFHARLAAHGSDCRGRRQCRGLIWLISSVIIMRLSTLFVRSTKGHMNKRRFGVNVGMIGRTYWASPFLPRIIQHHVCVWCVCLCTIASPSCTGPTDGLLSPCSIYCIYCVTPVQSASKAAHIIKKQEPWLVSLEPCGPTRGIFLKITVKKNTDTNNTDRIMNEWVLDL